MGPATMVVVMYDAIRMDVCGHGVLVSTGRTKVVDKAMNSPRRINEGQGRTRREGAKRIENRDRNRDSDAKSSGKTCQPRLRK